MSFFIWRASGVTYVAVLQVKQGSQAKLATFWTLELAAVSAQSIRDLVTLSNISDNPDPDLSTGRHGSSLWYSKASTKSQRSTLLPVFTRSSLADPSAANIWKRIPLCPRNQDSTFANCLMRRQLAWNLKSQFLKKRRSSVCRLQNLALHGKCWNKNKLYNVYPHLPP